MHDIINERAPINMSSFFTTISESHNYNTRSAVRGNLYQTKSRLHITQKSFANAGVKIWNALSISLRSLNKHSFTTRCKIILINTMMLVMITLILPKYCKQFRGLNVIRQYCFCFQYFLPI